MINILREFSFGNLNPCERPFKKDAEYSRALKAFVDAEEKLLAALNENEKALYEKYAAAQRNFSSLEDAEQFVSGYRYGALMMIDVMLGLDELVS